MSWKTVSDEYCSVHGLTMHMNGYCCKCSDIEKHKLDKEKNEKGDLHTDRRKKSHRRV